MTAMQPRERVPFDLFGMREPVRVSTLVRVGERGWTCGLCPLDANGGVVSPGSVLDQAGFVARMIVTVLGRGGFQRDDLAMLVIYHSASQREETAFRDTFEAAFPAGPVLSLIRVPHFYYDGMMLEVDAFADASLRPAHPERARFTDRYASAYRYVGLQGVTDADLKAQEDAAGISIDGVVWEHRVGAWDPVTAVTPEAVLRPALDGSNPCSAAFILAAHGSVVAKRAEQASVILTARRTGDTAVLTALSVAEDTGIVPQTRAIMAALDRELCEQGLGWAHVVKVSAPYVGGAREADLHDNLRIRHSFHVAPGPASTGLPAFGLGHSAARIAVQLTAIS